MNRILIALAAFVVWSGLAFGAGWLWRGDRAEGAESKRAATAATGAAQAQTTAREQEHQQAITQADIAEAYERGKHEAQSAADRVADDLRSGQLRLRKELGALYTSQLSGTAAGAAVDHADAERGAELAAAAVGVGAQSDAQLAACQAIVRADRGEVTP